MMILENKLKELYFHQLFNKEFQFSVLQDANLHFLPFFYMQKKAILLFPILILCELNQLLIIIFPLLFYLAIILHLMDIAKELYFQERD